MRDYFSKHRTTKRRRFVVLLFCFQQTSTKPARVQGSREVTSGKTHNYWEQKKTTPKRGFQLIQ